MVYAFMDRITHLAFAGVRLSSSPYPNWATVVTLAFDFLSSDAVGICTMRKLSLNAVWMKFPLRPLGNARPISVELSKSGQARAILFHLALRPDLTGLCVALA
jgi:hypothetical protein